jgi:hypothetical protein
MAPTGLTDVGSSREVNFARCLLLLECDEPRLLQQWVVPREERIEMTAGAGKGADEAAGQLLYLLCDCGGACPLPCRL